MENLFEIIEIKGKDYGCSAVKDLKKGTLILKEKPQLTDIRTSHNSESKNIETWTTYACKELLENFNTMSKTDQEDYFKLSNQYKEISLPRLDVKFGDSKTLEEIIGIYETNKFNGGVGIQASRFNHSCCSNAEGVWNKEDGSREFRIVKKVKSGDEITINYLGGDMFMKGYKERQDYLKKFWNFDCLCELCEKEKEYCNDISYETFVKLNQEAEIIKSNQSSMIYPITYLRLVALFKEMYKLAKEKQCPRTFIVQKLLQGGFQAAVSGYIHANFAEQKQDLTNMEIFRKECEVFTKAAVQISEIALPDTQLRLWKERRDSFDSWITEYLIKQMGGLKDLLT